MTESSRLYIICDPIQQKVHLVYFWFLHYLLEDLTSVPMIPNSPTKLKWYFWKNNFYKVCILFYFIYILHTIVFIISYVTYVTWSRKWVTCRKCQFLFSYTTFLKLQNASFWCKPHYNWISGYRVMKDLTMLKTIWNKGIWTLFLPISQKQHPWHPTHSSWSCHIFTLL